MRATCAGALPYAEPGAEKADHALELHAGPASTRGTGSPSRPGRMRPRTRSSTSEFEGGMGGGGLFMCGGSRGAYLSDQHFIANVWG